MEAVPQLRKLVLAGTIATLAVLGTSATAYGKGCNQNPPSSVAQYTEQIPQACGSSETGSGTKKRVIPKPIEQKIDKVAGPDAETLKDIVSSESSGAPQTTLKVAHKAKAKTKAKAKAKNNGHTQKAIVSDSAKRESNPLAASVGVITDGSDGRLIALIGLMVAVAALVVVSALRRRRVTR
jgi:hypothetical protein